MRRLIIIATVLLNSCQVFLPVDSIRQRELKFEFPQGEFDNGGRYFESMPLPDCQKYSSYNGSEPNHRKWAACMNVDYVTGDTN